MKRIKGYIQAFRSLKHWMFMVLLAFMLALSNVMLQETRMAGHSATRIEQDAEDPDEEPLT
jgi:hypothetical protein